MHLAQLPACLTLQLHITDTCNLRCAHCYQAPPTTEMSAEQCRAILAEFASLLLEISTRRGRHTRGHLNLTGGEPFSVPWFLELLAELSRTRTRLSVGILTNGTLITPAVADQLAAVAPGFVQVSIDGAPATHDRLRGEGSHALAVEGLRQLVQRRIRTLVSFTAHAGNFHEFKDVCAVAQRLRVSRLWVDRFIPLGHGREMKDQRLTPDQTLQLFQAIQRERRRSRFSRTEVAMHRALQFLVAGTEPYRCRAGHALLAILPNGALLPCRRLPLPAGNVFDTPLRELYFTSPVLQSLRESPAPSGACESCFYSDVCRGGLRCLSHAVYGVPHRADPGCWLAARKNPIVAGPQ